MIQCSYTCSQNCIDPKVVLQFGDGKGPIHIYNVNCMGNEATLPECEHSKTEVKNHHQCLHFDDVGVSCGKPYKIIENLYVCLQHRVCMQPHLAVKVKYDY